MIDIHIQVYSNTSQKKMNGLVFLITTLKLRLTKKILWRKQQNINVDIMNKLEFYFILMGQLFCQF